LKIKLEMSESGEELTQRCGKVAGFSCPQQMVLSEGIRTCMRIYSSASWALHFLMRKCVRACAGIVDIRCVVARMDRRSPLSQSNCVSVDDSLPH
jgi:hypothetical protein